MSNKMPDIVRRRDEFLASEGLPITRLPNWKLYPRQRIYRKGDHSHALWYMVSAGGARRDDVVGTITGTANAYIFKVPDIWEAFLRYDLATGPGAEFTTSGFGSFSQAVTDLDALADAVTAGAKWAIFYAILEPKHTLDIMSELCEQSPVTLWRSMYDSNFKVVVYDNSAPSSDNYFKDPYSNNYQWSYAEDMIKDSVRVYHTPLEDCFNEVRVEFDFYAPTGQYKGLSFVGPANSDDGNGTRDESTPGSRESKSLRVRDELDVSNVLTVQCDQIVQFEQAKQFRNYLFDRYHRPRLIIEFDTWARACGIEPNMTTLVSNDLTDYLPCPKYPDYTSAVNWDDLLFFVNHVSMRHTPQGDIWHLVLEEMPA